MSLLDDVLNPPPRRQLYIRRFVSDYDEASPLPAVGSRWEWVAQRMIVVVDEVKWNGEQWWIKASGHWQEPSNWWASVAVVDGQRAKMASATDRAAWLAQRGSAGGVV